MQRRTFAKLVAAAPVLTMLPATANAADAPDVFAVLTCDMSKRAFSDHEVYKVPEPHFKWFEVDVPADRNWGASRFGSQQPWGFVDGTPFDLGPTVQHLRDVFAHVIPSTRHGELWVHCSDGWLYCSMYRDRFDQTVARINPVTMRGNVDFSGPHNIE
jgi:hypothetical protein